MHRMRCEDILLIITQDQAEKMLAILEGHITWAYIRDASTPLPTVADVIMLELFLRDPEFMTALASYVHEPATDVSFTAADRILAQMKEVLV